MGSIKHLFKTEKVLWVSWVSWTVGDGTCEHCGWGTIEYLLKTEPRVDFNKRLERRLTAIWGDHASRGEKKLHVELIA